jgi:hypothetical protein
MKRIALLVPVSRLFQVLNARPITDCGCWLWLNTNPVGHEHGAGADRPQIVAVTATVATSS